MQRIPQLDGIRAIAILIVIVYHAMGIRLLWGGVDLFFVLSGFLITNILLNSKALSLGGYLARFYRRRAQRILAPYALFLVVVSIFCGVGWLRSWYLYLFLTNLLYPLHVFYPRVFGHLWSLAVEEQFYLLWPFAVYFLSVRRLRILCLVIMGAAIGLRATVHPSSYLDIYSLTPFRMDLLAAGALLCLVWREWPELVMKAGPAVGCGLSLLGLAGFTALWHLGISMHSNTPVGNALTYEASLALWLGFMIYGLSGWHVGWLRIAPLRYIGRISYSIYLIHYAIVLGLRAKGLPNGVVMLATVFALSLVYATLSWFLMEKKLLTIGRKAPIPDSSLLDAGSPRIFSSAAKNAASLHGAHSSAG